MAVSSSFLERLVLGVVAALTAIGMGVALYDATLFRAYTSEAGPVENLTVTMLLAGAFICFRRVRRLAGRRPGLFLAATALLGVLYLLAAGEELSWGQHVLGFKAPEFFKDHNAQSETNLHNMVVKGVKINRLVFGSGLLVFVLGYCVGLPVGYRRWPWLRRLADAVALPIPQTRHLVWYAALALVADLTPSNFKWEVMELVSATMFCLFTALPLNADAFRADPDRSPTSRGTDSAPIPRGTTRVGTR
jgi:hypothetical protein